MLSPGRGPPSRPTVSGSLNSPHASMRRTTLPASPLFGLLALLIAMFSLPGCNTAPSKRAIQYMNQEGFGRPVFGNAEEEEYVSIGDAVTVFDVAHPDEIDFRLVVAADGTVLLSEVGRIYIAGLTRTDLQSLLTRKYDPYFRDSPEIVVEISASERVFWVLGEVTKEGSFPFKGNQNIIDAIVSARPKKTSANLGRVMLIRADPTDPLRLPFNYNDLVIQGDSSLNYVLQENDIIWVPPTLMAEFGFFLQKMLYPVTAVLQSLGNGLWGGRRGNLGNNGNRAFGFAGLF